MIWAACCLSYFGFLRISEITVPSDDYFIADDHLGIANIADNSKENPTLLRVTIKKSKTDPFRQGVSLYLGRTSSDICPVSATISYLEKRSLAAGVLFKQQDGCQLTWERFVKAARDRLRRAGVDCSKYCSHSFRIGAAMAAARAGIEDSVIKTLGQWECSLSTIC